MDRPPRLFAVHQQADAIAAAGRWSGRREPAVAQADVDRVLPGVPGAFVRDDEAGRPRRNPRVEQHGVDRTALSVRAVPRDADARRQVDRIQGLLADGGDDGGVEGLDQLPDVAGPRVPLQRRDRYLDPRLQPIIDKTRYLIKHAGLTWEIDVFAGENQGLVIAEVELDDEQQTITLPPWAGKEVTGDQRYFNAYLVNHPYVNWPDAST